ncbi:MAG TPA: urate oxidase [Metabacillus sp.]|nr:urate oxidase [Metabacillus sp.]
MVTLSELNEVSHREFVEFLGDIFEHSPWVPEKAWAYRPFASLTDLHEKMVLIVKEAAYEEKLALIQAHPNLGTRLEMSGASVQEQAGVGLNQLTTEEFVQFSALNKQYMDKFGFPFIMAVKGQTKTIIYESMHQRINHSELEEFETALKEIEKIAYFRLKELIKIRGAHMKKQRTVSYGKGNVFAYRTFLAPLEGVKQIPESDFAGRSNIVFGVNVKMEVGGQKLLPSFTEGDNSLVVATDSMKNFVQRHLGSYEGSTIEGFLRYVAEEFLNKYDHIDTIKLIGEEVPFELTKTASADGLTQSDLVFKHSRNEKAIATIEMVRNSETIDIVHQSSGVLDLQLIKVRGNSFVGFIRDEYTTLPEDSNRPLFIYLNIGWEYEDIEDSVGSAPHSYVCAEQVRDIATSVFHELETPSIQHLVYLIGCRVLERFPQLREVNFQSQNHTWDPVVEKIPNSEGKVYTEPRPPYGFQHFTVTKEDLETSKELSETMNISK